MSKKQPYRPQAYTANLNAPAHIPHQIIGIMPHELITKKHTDIKMQTLCILV
jgi:hypothetical protein